MLLGEITDLALAYAMLARAGAVHADRPLDQAIEEALHLPPLLGVARVEQRHDVKIAVADMADDRSKQARFLDIGMGLADASGKRRNRHADIGGDDLSAGKQASHRPVGVMARLPKLGALLWPFRPAELPSPFASRNLGEGLDLLARACRRAVELEKKRRRSSVRCE